MKKGLVLLIVFLLVCIVGCSDKKVEMSEAGSPESDKKVLILTQVGDFKKGIIDSVINEFGDLYFKVIDLKDSEVIMTDEFDVIILFNTLKMAKAEKAALAFIENLKDKNKLLFITTTGSMEDFNPALEGVDSISGASKPERKEKFVTVITGKINSIVNIVEEVEMEEEIMEE